ncbi:hypothetical protein LTR94_027673 [Friedmanniomyces endolithicus]|nr:hypothetical protein LTR94_027673 [Friedmanniomyces endolithicus]
MSPTSSVSMAAKGAKLAWTRSNVSTITASAEAATIWRKKKSGSSGASMRQPTRPPAGARSIRPSPPNQANASRTGVVESPKAFASSRMMIDSPGENTPVTTRSRSVRKAAANGSRLRATQGSLDSESSGYGYSLLS